MNKFLKTIILPAIALLCPASCVHKPATPATIEEICNYIVNPSQSKYDTLSNRSANDTLLAAAFRAARTNAQTGMAAQWLTDSAGAAYRLGYQTPASIAADTTYPLIIYLHGGIGTERNDKGDSAFFMLKDLADTFKLFLASPSANRYAPWWSAAGLSRILQTLRFMTLHYPINPNKVFLAGVSDGATGCYAAANTICSPFAGFIAVSGFGGMLPMLGMQLAPGNLMQRPIYNVNAGLDHIYPVENVKEFVGLLQERGVNITSKIYPDEKHGFDYRAKEMGTLATLVRTWSRPAARGLSWTFVPGVPNLPDNTFGWSLSSDDASVNASWRRDTLVVRSQGIAALTVSFPRLAPGKKIFCRFVSDSAKPRVRAFAPTKTNWPENLRTMSVRGFPDVRESANVYRIKFQ
jgi:acetyl esterase/lipase